MKTPVNIFWGRKAAVVVAVGCVSMFILVAVPLVVYFVPPHSESTRALVAFTMLMGAGTAVLSALGYVVVVAQAFLLEIRESNKRLSK